jgi:hypothetical protein
MARTALSLGAALLILSSALPANTADQDSAANPRDHVYTSAGEVVVHAIGDQGLLLAVDKEGRGVVTETFLVTTYRPLPAGLEFRSTDAKVEYRKDAVYVTLPRAHRLLVISYPDDESREGGPDPRPARQEPGVTRIGSLSTLSDGPNFPWSRTPITLDDVQAGRLPRVMEIIGRGPD